MSICLVLQVGICSAPHLTKLFAYGPWR